MNKKPVRGLKKILQKLGPGLLTGAADNDPSGITTYSQTGAKFGPGLIWTIPFMLPLMYVVQEMCGRIGLVTGKGISAVLREHYPRRVVAIAAFLLFVANSVNIGANIAGMAAAARLIVPQVPFAVFAGAFIIAVLSIEVFSKYKSYSHILKWLTIALFAYMLTGFIAIKNWGEVIAYTFIPHLSFDPQFLMMLTAVFGTTISPYLFFWQASLETEEKRLHHEGKEDAESGIKPEHMKTMRFDTLSGMAFSQITAWFIIATSWVVLFNSGITEIDTAADAAEALEPLVSGFPHANTIASFIFAIGIIGLGLLSIPALATSASYAVSEVFGWREGISYKFKRAVGFYAMIVLATVSGLLIYIFGVSAIQALILAAVINGILAPILIFFILLICNNKNIMGEYVNTKLSNVIGIFTVIAMGLSAVLYLIFLWA